MVACHPFVTSCFADSADKTNHYRDKVKYSTYSGDHDGMEIVRMDVYNQRCMDYITNNQYLVDWKVFPPIYLDFKHDLTKEIAMEFHECLSSTGSRGVILCGYNSLSHSDFLLQSSSSKNNRNYSNRLLLINTSLNTIVNVRITKSNNPDQVREEWKSCSDDITEFIGLHNKYLNNSKTVLISVVAAPNIEQDLGSNVFFEDVCYSCEYCNKLTLTKKELGRENRQHLKQWFKDVLPNYISQLRSQHNMEQVPPETKEPCSLIAGQIIGYMASIPNQVPPLSGNIHTQLQNVQLNNDQINAYLCPKKKKIIKGCYGSGKSIIGKLQLESLIKEADKNSSLYYITFDPYSILDSFVKLSVEPLVKQRGNNCPQVNIVTSDSVALAKQLHISTVPVLSEVLIALSEKHRGDGHLCHIICDEFDGETLTEEEAKKVKDALETLDGSFVTIIAQSLEKHRSVVNGKNVEHFDGFQYHLTGMEIIDLTKSMRNSVHIYNLLSVAQKIVSQTDTVFQHPKLNKRGELVLTTESKSFNPFKQRARVGEAVATSNLSTVKKATFFRSLEDGVMENIATQHIKDLPLTENLSTNQNPVASASSIDFDAISHLLDKGRYQLSSTKTIYTPNYVPSQGIGHSFYGNKPKLLYLSKVSQLWKRLKMLNVKCLEQHIQVFKLLSGVHNILNSSSVILCTDIEEVMLFSSVLTALHVRFTEYVPYLRNPHVFPHSSVKEKVAVDLINGGNVVTDRRGFRGMECKKIIMVINPDEYLNSQNLIENMARATSDLNLVLMSKPDKQKSRKSDLFNNVIKKWEMNDLVTVIKHSYSDEQLLKWSKIIPKTVEEYADVFKVSKEFLPR